MRYVIVPGINGSDAAHWQSVWEAEWGRYASRIEPASWDEPDLEDWRRAIDRAVGADRDVVLVSHSLGCLTVADWVVRGGHGVRGVFLVAPPDSAGPAFPADVAQALADAWGLDRIGAGGAGHLNSASGLGRWDFGRALLTAFTAGVSRAKASGLPSRPTAT